MVRAASAANKMMYGVQTLSEPCFREKAQKGKLPNGRQYQPFRSSELSKTPSTELRLRTYQA